jgi:Protein of unknown function (DUF2878)
MSLRRVSLVVGVGLACVLAVVRAHGADDPQVEATRAAVEQVFNYRLYETGWCACVLGAAFGHPWVGSTLGILPIIVHLVSAQRRCDALVLTLWTGAIGLLVDTTQIALGMLHFQVGTLVSWLPPPWLGREGIAAYRWKDAPALP